MGRRATSIATISALLNVVHLPMIAMRLVWSWWMHCIRKWKDVNPKINVKLEANKS